MLFRSRASKPDQLPPAATLADLYARLRLNGKEIPKGSELRQAVLDALARSPDPAVQPIVRKIGDEEPAMRDAVARVLHDECILCEPDSREPWFMSAAHDDSCLKDTLTAFETAIDRTLDSLGTTRRMPA